MKALNSFLTSFCDRFAIPHPPDDFYGPIYTEKDTGRDKGKADPRAVVLCKLLHSEGLEERFRGKQKHSSNDGDCYQITWSELQELKSSLCKVHNAKNSLLSPQNKDSVLLLNIACEYTNLSPDDVLSSIQEPDWNAKHSGDDWQSYIDKEFRDVWPELALDARLVGFAIAANRSQEEDWRDD
jgi:hypothetical protein